MSVDCKVNCRLVAGHFVLLRAASCFFLSSLTTWYSLVCLHLKCLNRFDVLFECFRVSPQMVQAALLESVSCLSKYCHTTLLQQSLPTIYTYVQCVVVECVHFALLTCAPLPHPPQQWSPWRFRVCRMPGNRNCLQSLRGERE